MLLSLFMSDKELSGDSYVRGLWKNDNKLPTHVFFRDSFYVVYSLSDRKKTVRNVFFVNNIYLDILSSISKLNKIRCSTSLHKH